MATLAPLAVAGALVALVVVVTATAAPPACTHGVSSAGPVVLVNGHLDRSQSDLAARTAACLRGS
jgi:hypothetical protein